MADSTTPSSEKPAEQLSEAQKLWNKIAPGNTDENGVLLGTLSDALAKQKLSKSEGVQVAGELNFLGFSIVEEGLTKIKIAQALLAPLTSDQSVALRGESGATLGILALSKEAVEKLDRNGDGITTHEEALGAFRKMQADLQSLTDVPEAKNLSKPVDPAAKGK